MLEKSGQIGKSLFADDFILYHAGKNKDETTHKIQTNIDKIIGTAREMGWEMSREKTKGMVFTRKNKDTITNLRVDGTNINFVKHHKILGIIFDTKLTWKHHKTK